MRYRELRGTTEYVCRLVHGRDWRAQVEEFAGEEGIEAAVFHGLGAVQDAEVYFYDQERLEYDSVVFSEPLEVAACVGNVSLLDEDPFAHTHAVLSKPDGTALAGHLNSATVWAGELYVRAFGVPLVRERDERTGLDLWDL